MLRETGALAAAATVVSVPFVVTEPAGLSVGESGVGCADAIGVDQPRASRLVQEAVEMGLAAREADPDDARRTRIALTFEGRRRAGDFRGERRERLSRALADFTDAERAELVRLLGKLAASWPRD